MSGETVYVEATGPQIWEQLSRVNMLNPMGKIKDREDPAIEQGSNAVFRLLRRLVHECVTDSDAKLSARVNPYKMVMRNFSVRQPEAAPAQQYPQRITQRVQHRICGVNSHPKRLFLNMQLAHLYSSLIGLVASRVGLVPSPSEVPGEGTNGGAE